MSITFFLTSVFLGVGLAVDSFLISLSNGLNQANTKQGRVISSAIVFALFQLIAVILGWVCVAEISKIIPLLESILCYIAFIILMIIGTKMIAEWAEKRRKDIKKHNTMQNSTQKTQEYFVDNTMHNNNKTINDFSSITITQNNQRNCKDKARKNSETASNKIDKNTTARKSGGNKKTGFTTLILQALITSVDALSVGFVISDRSLTQAITCGTIISIITFIMYVVGFVTGKKFGAKFSIWAELVGGIVFILIAIETLITSIIK